MRFLQLMITVRQLLSVCLFFCAQLSFAQDVSIYGFYLDKKDSVLSNASVILVVEGVEVDSSLTMQNGSFMLTYSKAPVSLEQEIPDELKIFPNPFSDELIIEANFQGINTFQVHDFQGRLIIRQNIRITGRSMIRWGGTDSQGTSLTPGIYFISLLKNDGIYSQKKVIYLGGGNGGLNIEKVASSTNQVVNNHNSGARSTDDQNYIQFVKAGTSSLNYPISFPEQDIDLGTIAGNAGPSIISDIAGGTLENEQEFFIDLDTCFYNDDQCTYATSNSDITIEASILSIKKSGPDTIFVEITATDQVDTNLKASQSFQLIIEGPNQAPRITNFSTVRFLEDSIDTSIDLDNYVLDETPDSEITWTLEGLVNVQYEILSDNTLRFSATENWFGIEYINVTAEDEEGLQNSKLLEVIVYSVNDVPVFDGNIDSHTITEDDTILVSIKGFSDIDNNLIFYIPNLPDSVQAWIIEDSIGILTGIPIGNYENLFVEAIEEETNETYYVISNLFNISVLEIPDTISPLILLPDEIQLDEDSSATFNKSDFLSDNIDMSTDITWNFHDINNVGVTLSDSVAVIKQLQENWYGIDTISVTATDNSGNSSEMQIIVTVEPINDKPFLNQNINNFSIDLGDTIVIDLNAFTDIEGDSLKFEIPLLPPDKQILYLEDAILVIKRLGGGIHTDLVLVATETDTEDLLSIESNTFNIEVIFPPGPPVDPPDPPID